MKFKLREAKECRGVGIPSNKLSGAGQQRYLQNKSINQNINWPKVGKLKVKTGALGKQEEREEVFYDWTPFHGHSCGKHVYHQERCLILVNMGRC